eukprot:758616-Hanusia_phi.AAC.2
MFLQGDNVRPGVMRSERGRQRQRGERGSEGRREGIKGFDDVCCRFLCWSTTLIGSCGYNKLCNE